MKLGVFDHLDDSGRPLETHYAERLELVERYDQAGFHAYHLAEHHATPLGMAPSPNVFLAAVAARTRRLRFGPMVYCLPLYHPLRLFEEICMLDQMSGGRLEFGVGRGISPIEAGYFGIEADDARGMMEEALALIRQAMTEKTLTFNGRYYQVSEMPIELAPAQQPHPPLWYGVVDPAGAARCAEAGMSLITNRGPADVRQITDAYRAAWQESGGDPADLPLLGMSRHIVVAEDAARALDLARPAYRRWRASFMKLWDQHGMAPINVKLPAEIDQMIESGLAIIGTPGQVADEILTQIEITGANYFATRFAFGDLPQAAARRSVDLFVDHVMPELPLAD